ncbi:MAG: autotransporter outer membrane beta-barrel domain-containing protein [gamma proteobacterium symbiont of Taylorina sp.]|nr:autotransporter outer membrane beta-barrel domain-containing protein [gamma proteobacterium symbiont of Taylorina sp.]
MKIILVFLLILQPILVYAASSDQKDVDNFEEQTNAILSLMGYSIFPDVTTSSLSIQNGSTGDPGFVLTQFAGGFTISDNFPLYLEGGIAYSRYDPTIVLGDAVNETSFSFKWNSLSLAGGIGWDFELTEKLVLRPMFNFMAGQIESDLSVAGRFADWILDTNLDAFDNGRMRAYGLGGTLMLDYEDYTPEREIDAEFRLGDVYMEGFHDSSDFALGSANIVTANIWGRYRAPIGFNLLKKPVRYVLEASHSEFLGDQRGILGFNSLSSVGVGIELDSSEYPVIITRTRLIIRHVFGHNVSGSSIGLSISF